MPLLWHVVLLVLSPLLKNYKLPLILLSGMSLTYRREKQREFQMYRDRSRTLQRHRQEPLEVPEQLS